MLGNSHSLQFILISNARNELNGHQLKILDVIYTFFIFFFLSWLKFSLYLELVLQKQKSTRTLNFFQNHLSKWQIYYPHHMYIPPFLVSSLLDPGPLISVDCCLKWHHLKRQNDNKETVTIDKRCLHYRTKLRFDYFHLFIVCTHCFTYQGTHVDWWLTNFCSPSLHHKSKWASWFLKIFNFEP